MVINIRATGIELTPAIREYAETKLQSLTKFIDTITQITIDIGMVNHHHHKGEIFYCEANVLIPNNMVRVVKEEPDLYKAIDKVKDHLKVELKNTKAKMSHKDKDVIRDQKAYHEED